MDRHLAAEAPGEAGRDDAHALEVTAVRPAHQAGRDEKRLALGGDADPLELRGRRGERGLARIVRRSGKRQRGRLDHDRRSPASPCQRRERLAGQRETERVADRGPHVVERFPRRRRPQHDRVVRRIDDDHAAA